MAGSDTRERAFSRLAYGAGRASAQRLTIARAADARCGRAFSVEDLAASAREEDPGIGIATVYRAVAAMEAAGYIEQLGTYGGASLYARCHSGGHHHHLLCTACNAVTDVECPIDEEPARADAEFRVTGHRLVLYGLCGACDALAGGLGPEAVRAGDADCCGSGVDG